MPEVTLNSAERLLFRGNYSQRIIVLYKVPVRRLRPHIPEVFNIPSFTRDGKAFAYIGIEFIFQNAVWLSALPYNKFSSHITNYFSFVRKNKSNDYGIFYWGGVVSGFLKFWKAVVWNAPWYTAQFLVKSDISDNTLNHIDISNIGAQLALSLNANTHADFSIDEQYILEDLENIQNPAFYCFENLSNKHKLHFFKLNRMPKSRQYLKIENIQAEVMQNLCLLTTEEMKSPFVAFAESTQQYDIKFLKYND